MNTNRYPGPSVPISNEIDKMKYRQDGEDFHDKVERISHALADNPEHEEEFLEILGNQRFLPAGRVQSSIGAKKLVTAFNCYVSGEIEDSMKSIMDKAAEAAETLRMGGGIGYDFSKLRPRGISSTLFPVSPVGLYHSWESSMQSVKP